MIPVESLYAGKFDDYTRLFIEIPFPVKMAGLHLQPGGSYVRAFYRGPWEEICRRYEEIFDYVKRNGLILAGYSYEIIINENVIDKEEDAIVQIEIPVKKEEKGGFP